MVSNHPEWRLNKEETEKLRDKGMGADTRQIEMSLQRVMKYRQEHWTAWPDIKFKDFEEPIRIMLVGLGGSGKSSLGNVLLRRLEFKTAKGPHSETLQCQSAKMKYKETEVHVIDTPGYLIEEAIESTSHRELAKNNIEQVRPHFMDVMLRYRKVFF